MFPTVKYANIPFSMFKSLVSKATSKLTLTMYPIVRLVFLLIEMVQQPSPSIIPDMYQEFKTGENSTSLYFIMFMFIIFLILIFYYISNLFLPNSNFILTKNLFQ